ncbi:hypothetical protein CMI42_01160 [Candidatus Pacearchaeota archaeon]|nr:hypothetical protein [Candidatus Pacearchaeota archaeon]
MTELKVYIAGKVNPNSVFGTHDWRDSFCEKLSKETGFKIVNLDPTKSNENLSLDEGNPNLIFGRDCHMIKSADVIIVVLTDDISVGGSQEMLISKYFSKPLIGIAQKGGKFVKEEKEILGKVYKNWTHPFVDIPCDALFEDIEGAADFIKKITSESKVDIKGISVIDEAVNYYKKNHHHL